MRGGFNTNVTLKLTNWFYLVNFPFLISSNIFDTRCLPTADFYSWAINLLRNAASEGKADTVWTWSSHLILPADAVLEGWDGEKDMLFKGRGNVQTWVYFASFYFSSKIKQH